jgi:hypothetical protein
MGSQFRFPEAENGRPKFTAAAGRGGYAWHRLWFTREEFRKVIASGAPLTFTDTYVVQRRFDDVVKSLQQKADDCLQVDARMTRTSGGIQTMNTKDEYRTSVRVVDKNRAELTTQMTMKGAIVVQQ